MNLQKIYIELMKKKNDDYYIELAKQETLIIPVLIEIMLDCDINRSRWAENLLEKISAANPMNVYPYFNYICSVFERHNNITTWNCWKIIANILSVDIYKYWDNLREKYLFALSSDMITEFLIALSVADKIIAAKPDDSEIIISTIKSSAEKNFIVCGAVSESCQKIAVNAVQNFLEKIQNSQTNFD